MSLLARGLAHARSAFTTFFAPTVALAKATVTVLRWVVTLLIAYAALILLFPVYLLMALAWVTLKKIAGEKARVTIKLN